MPYAATPSRKPRRDSVISRRVTQCLTSFGPESSPPQSPAPIAACASSARGGVTSSRDCPGVAATDQCAEALGRGAGHLCGRLRDLVTRLVVVRRAGNLPE